MKQVIRLVLGALGALGTISAVQAQSANPAIWCPPGSVWTYGYGEMSVSGTVSVRYAGDTLVNGQSAQVLRQTATTAFYISPGVPFPPSISTWSLPKVITRVVGDRVEVHANGRFYTLYDFAAQPGATWLTVPVTPSGPCAQGLVQVTVDSVGRKQVAGRSLRWFRMHLTGASGTQPGTWSGRVYELLGSVYYMQPQSPICHGTDPGFMWPLQTFSTTGPPPFSVVIRNGSLALSNQRQAEATGFAVFPNPVVGTTQLTVQLPAKVDSDAQLLLLDAMGREVRREALVATPTLDVRGLPAGTYTLLLHQPGKAGLARRVVLQ